MNWRDQTRVDRLVFEQVDPNNLDFVRDTLEGVVLDGSSLSESYYSDTRISGTLKLHDSNYIDNSMIRIHHYVDEWDYHNELGTFFVVDDDLSYEHGAWTGSLDLRSTLFGLAEEDWTLHYTIASGKYSKTVLSELFNQCNRPHRILSSLNNTKYSKAVVYAFGDNVLSTVFDICEVCSGRLDVDGHGLVTVSPYILPSSLFSVFEYDYDEIDSMIISEVNRSSDRKDLSGRAGVIFKEGDNEIFAFADAPASSPFSPGRRGYRRTEIFSLNELSPKTKAQAQAIANQKIQTVSTEAIEYSFNSLYIPWGQGYAVDFTIDGKRNKCLIKNKETSFAPGMPIKIDLKVV